MRLLFAVSCGLFFLTPSCPAFTHLNTDELYARADLVVLADVVSVDQGLETTKAQVRVSQVLKGSSVAQGALVLIESPGGRVFIEESEPAWSDRQANLLFLQGPVDGAYACVNQGDGQKRIWGDSIYPYHDNQSFAVPLKDYLKALESIVKADRGQEARR
jgi:hypothetical protein